MYSQSWKKMKNRLVYSPWVLQSTVVVPPANFMQYWTVNYLAHILESFFDDITPITLMTEGPSARAYELKELLQYV